MTYIILTAGRGSRLHPLTLQHPKTLYRLDRNTTVLQRMVSLIKKYDEQAEIVIVIGFMSEKIESEIKNVTFVKNPFYEVTNSIASLWFAKEFLQRNQVTIINGDIVMEEKIVRDFICKETEEPYVCLDSGIKNKGDYNVQVNGKKVLVMSKELDEYYGEYAGVTKLDKTSSAELCKHLEEMVEMQMYDQWYENVLVQMIFNYDFDLFYRDIRDYKWTEVDCVGDMLLARQIHGNE